MTEGYTRKQVMELLGLLRLGAVDELAKKYPEAFVRVNTSKRNTLQYDRAALDKFANSRKIFQESIETNSKR